MSWLSSGLNKLKKWQPGKTLKKAAPAIGGILGSAFLPGVGTTWGAAIGSALGKAAQKGTKVQLGDVLKAGASGAIGDQLGRKLWGSAIAKLTGKGGQMAVPDMGGSRAVTSLAGSAPTASYAVPSVSSVMTSSAPVNVSGANVASKPGMWSGALSKATQVAPKSGWGALTALEKGQLVTQGGGALAKAYGAMQQGKMADKEFAVAEADRRRQIEEDEKRRAAMAAAWQATSAGWGA